VYKQSQWVLDSPAHSGVHVIQMDWISINRLKYYMIRPEYASSTEVRFSRAIRPSVESTSDDAM
jgi:hypothetical protein